jgi:hypothetical protein
MIVQLTALPSLFGVSGAGIVLPGFFLENLMKIIRHGIFAAGLAATLCAQAQLSLVQEGQPVAGTNAWMPGTVGMVPQTRNFHPDSMAMSVAGAADTNLLCEVSETGVVQGVTTLTTMPGD